jgi:hypothetical protein
MNKLTEIAKSWIAAANPTSEQQQIAEDRISICDECPYKKYIKTLNVYICDECGCPLDKKIFSPLPGPEACPLSKWKI